MKNATPLPSYLTNRYRGWKATSYAENEAWYRHLGEEGQTPRAMVISCCDSRVHATALFQAEQGEFFMHRNIANLVPPCKPGKDSAGTSAAIEYAVKVLKVAHIIVVGHSNCGGVSGCDDMCRGHAPELDAESSFVGRWIEHLRPAYERVKDISDDQKRKRALEKEGVLLSIENLISHPFVKEAVDNGELSLHALWKDIPTGILEGFDPAEGFVPV